MQFVDSVTIDATGAGSPGAVRYISSICPALARHSPDTIFHLIARASQFIDLPVLPSNIRPILATSHTKRPWIRLIWLHLRLPLLIRKLGPDVHLAAFEVSALKLPKPTVLVVHNHNPFSPLRSGLWGRGRLARMMVQRQVIKGAANRAKQVVFVSEWSRRTLAPMLKVPLHKTAVAHHGVDSIFRPALSQADPTAVDGHPFILTVSAVLEHKNLDRLVVAYKGLLADTQHNPDLVIAGPLESPEATKRLRLLIQSENLDHKVRLLGVVSPGELSRLYQQAKLLALPSLVETFGLPLVEAMASGLPVAASRVGPIPEVCGDAAWYFDPYDPEDMGRTIRAALEHPIERAAMVEKGMEKASEYTWEATAAKMMSILDRAAHR